METAPIHFVLKPAFLRTMNTYFFKYVSCVFLHMHHKLVYIRYILMNRRIMSNILRDRKKFPMREVRLQFTENLYYYDIII